MADYARPASDVDLVSTTVKVERKVFYLDFKENIHGRYLKISEKGSGMRSTVVVPAPELGQFVGLLEHYCAQAGNSEAMLPEDRQMFQCYSTQGEEVQELRVSREFAFEVKENARGRYLRIEEVRGGAGGQRAIILVPEGATSHPTGWELFTSAVSEVVEKISSLHPHDPESIASLPGMATAAESNHPQNIVATGNKKFFFDVGQNMRGSYLRITEQVRKNNNERTSILIPTEALNEFHTMFAAMMEQALNKEASSENHM